MDEDRKTSIKDALRRYQETVLEHNISTLRILVEGMEAQPTPPGWPESIATERRMHAFSWYFTGSVPEDLATSPRELLADNVRTELISLYDFDGISHKDIDSDARANWFNTLQANIAEKEVAVDKFPPADLEYLCTLVSGVFAPGLPYHVEQQQFAFVSPLEDVEAEELEATAERVVVTDRDDEDNAFMCMWEEWEIAVAVKIGDGPRDWGGSYVLYCRNESREEWAWRYGVHDETWCSELFDTVEEYLDFYSHHREQAEDEVKGDVRDLRQP